MIACPTNATSSQIDELLDLIRSALCYNVEAEGTVEDEWWNTGTISGDVLDKTIFAYTKALAI